MRRMLWMGCALLASGCVVREYRPPPPPPVVYRSAPTAAGAHRRARGRGGDRRRAAARPAGGGGHPLGASSDALGPSAPGPVRRGGLGRRSLDLVER